MNELGQYIIDHRMKRQLSIRRLAELAHISHTEIYRLENGERKNPSLLVLKSISDALGQNFNEMLKNLGYIDNNAVQKPLVSTILFDIDDLTEREIEEVQNFIDFLRNKRIKTNSKREEI